ncbi:hypothetical protein AAFF_G00230430 [Aldrovandia affinis]|uniref:Uncharacterized protein n=1 Tax=Aldrovandia affinis TaxID=143900 RepID=A0AAD7W4G6_9TELE|nr:hypothetical protein AAFF_G00230430 [Aldrovandia affinis]
MAAGVGSGETRQGSRSDSVELLGAKMRSSITGSPLSRLTVCAGCQSDSSPVPYAPGIQGGAGWGGLGSVWGIKSGRHQGRGPLADIRNRFGSVVVCVPVCGRARSRSVVSNGCVGRTQAVESRV